PYSFTWNFGDGSALGTGNPVQHTYTTKGSKTVSLTVTDANAATAPSSQVITVAPITLAVSFTTAPTTGTVGSSVSFTVTASGGTTPYAFSWNFGDGSGNQAGGATNPNTLSHTYNTKGTFVVKVNVTDSNAKLATASSSIAIVGTPLTLPFTTAPTTGTVGKSVSFTAQAAGDTAPYTFSWNFGDGTANVSGGTTNPNTQSHTYNNKGTFTVKVNVTDANGAKQTASSVITISPITLAIAFTVAPTTGTVGTAVSFTANASGGTTPYAFSWNFGDGTANVAGGATNPNTQSHTYNVKGTFTVKVNVTDANAKLATATSSITITGTALTVAFTVAPSTGTVGTSISFTAQAAGDTVPYTFSWSFGDGSAKVAGGTTNPNTQPHTYNVKGTYTVRVNATSANAKLATATATITISPLTLSVSFTTAPTTGTVGTAVSFTASASGGTTPYAFSWNFGDGT